MNEDDDFDWDAIDWSYYESTNRKSESILLNPESPYDHVKDHSSSSSTNVFHSREKEEELGKEGQEEENIKEDEDSELDDEVGDSSDGENPRSISSSLDLTEYFTTEKVFDSKEAIQKWCMEQGKKKNCVIVCKSSRTKNSDGNGKSSYLEMQCERSGVYASHKSKKHEPKTPMKRKRQCGSKKCGCPFMLSALCKDDGKWYLRVRCGIHNHALPNKLTGHAFVARLTEEEMKKMEDMTKAGHRPRMIVRALKETKCCYKH